MNILFLCTFQATENASGGISRVTVNLSRVFSDHGHVCNLAYLYPVEGKESGVFKVSSKLEQGKELAMLTSMFKETDIVIVQSQMTKKNLRLLPILDQFRNECGAKLVYCHHSDPFSEVVGNDWHFLNWILFHSSGNLSSRFHEALWGLACILFTKSMKKRIAVRRQAVQDIMDKVVLLSESFVPKYTEFIKVKNSDIVSIGNCFTYSESGYSETEKENTVLVVSNMVEHSKRISKILRIWRNTMEKEETSSWRLLIVGDGVDFEEYRKMASRMNLKNYSFEGRQDPLPYYRKSKLLIMTSAFEGFGMVILEAQQMGCVPVVTNTWPSVGDLICDGVNGVIVKNRNVEDVADVLYGLMNDNEQRKSLSAKCAMKNDAFSEQKIYGKWEYLFNQLKK